jgi:predicted GNAT family acetyltransferase
MLLSERNRLDGLWCAEAPTKRGRPMSDALELVDVPERKRYELRAGDEVVAFAEYILTSRQDRIVITHTEVDPEHEGRGLGSAAARAVLDDVRGRGLLVQPLCPFMAAYIARHPEYTDLVVPEMRARFAGGTRSG